MGSGGDGQAVLKLLEVMTMSLVPAALKAAVQLRVMDILAEHAPAQDQYLSAKQIAAHFEQPLTATTSCDEAAASLDRLLRLLASHGILAASSHVSPSQGRPITCYALNSLSRLLVQSTGRPSLAPYQLLFQHPAILLSFSDLHLSLLDGENPFTKAHGTNMISFCQHNPSFDQVFNNAMASHTSLFMHSLLDTYTGFNDISTLVDVGGGIGASLGMITSKHPHIRGINFDLPHIIAGAPKYHGVEHMGGDMFKTVPKGDAIFMKWMLHGWDDAHCIKLLDKCYEVLPSKGKVILVDYMLPDEIECGINARLGHRMDIIMFISILGGKERTKREMETIFKASQFSSSQVICNVHACSVVELYK